MKPDMSTIYTLPWIKDEEGTTAMSEVICDAYWKCKDRDFAPINFSPRHIAQVQLDRLKDRGLYLLSSFEFEFRLQKRVESSSDNSYKWAYGLDYYSSVFKLKIESYLIKLEKALRAQDIFVEGIHTELGSGMLEVTLEPLQGLLAADAAFRFKKTANEIANLFDMRACFMAKPVLTEAGNDLHFNHSLWRRADNTNVFNDKDEFSQQGVHWVSGMVTYGNNTLACYCPTMNCYRRVNDHAWGPDKLNWGLEGRITTTRVKEGIPSDTYVENRIPSGIGNPYLILAANIVAGLLGIDKKIEVKKNDENAELLSRTLEDAVAGLKKNEEFVKLLGAEFVDVFSQNKLDCEVKNMSEKFRSCCKTADQELEIENEFYMELL